MDLVVQMYKRKKIADKVDWIRDKKKKKKKVDWISELSDDVLLLILSRLPTKEAIRTSVVSKRWEHVWKQMPHLVLDTRRRFNFGMLRRRDDSNPDAALTRVINNHYGHLESCEIIHSSNKKGEHGLLKTWIQTVETRNLTLASRNYRSLCSFPVDFFSHSKLSSLSLKSYTFSSSIPFFQNWSNIKTLKLLSISCPEVGVFNDILAFCPSLEVLLLNNIKCSHTMGSKSCLEIKNSKLKFLEIFSMYDIDKVIVSAPNLDILVVKDIYALGREFLLQSPNLRFIGTCRNKWLYIIYNISMEKNNVYEDLVKRIGELKGEEDPALSMVVDLMNETEVERLRQVMSLMSDRLRYFGIKFKGNNALSPSEEIECWQKKLWLENDHEDPFPDAKFRVNVVVIYNFKGSKEEIAFVSCLIRQRKVKRRILINSNSFSASNMSNIEAAVAKLQDVQLDDQKKVTFAHKLVFRSWVELIWNEPEN